MPARQIIHPASIRLPIEQPDPDMQHSCLKAVSMQVLILAWRLGAQRMGYFSRAEFCSGIPLWMPTSMIPASFAPGIPNTQGIEANPGNDTEICSATMKLSSWLHVL